MENFKIETINHFWGVIAVGISALFFVLTSFMLKNKDLVILMLFLGFLLLVFLNRLCRSHLHISLNKKSLTVTKKIIPFLSFRRNYQINLNEIDEVTDLKDRLYTLYKISSKSGNTISISRYIYWKDDRDDYGKYKEAIRRLKYDRK